MHGTQPHSFLLESGRRVRTRAHQWTILNSSRGIDCRGVTLLPEDASYQSTRTLLDPFDRFRSIEPSARPHVVHPRRWLHALRRHLAEMRPSGGLIAPARTSLRLLDWQLEPALAVLKHGVSRILIADGVGLGKTIQAGFLIAELQVQSQTTRVLVLVPAGLRHQWASELGRHFGLHVFEADADWLMAARHDRPADVNPWALPGIYLSSHDFVKRPEVLRPLEDVTWDLLVIDEAHAASLHTDRRAAADAVARRSRRVALLTATPHADVPAEFDALCRLGYLEGESPKIMLFRRSRIDIGASVPRRSVLLPVRPSIAEQRTLQLLYQYTRRVWVESGARRDHVARLASIVLRKRALSSSGSLLSSVRRRMDLLLGRMESCESQLCLPLGDEDPLVDQEPSATLAAPGLADARREQRWLASIAEAARQAARNETKVRYLLRLLRRIKEPVIVFTEYRDTLIRLQRTLAANRIATLVMHGGLSAGERSRVQRAFNESPVTLLATDAASEGLNLHERCRVVIHFELPWSISRLEQRAGRVDRLGQARRVHEMALVAADTAESLVLGPLARRAVRAVSSGSSSGLLTALSESRVAEMVLGDADPANAADFAPGESLGWTFATAPHPQSRQRAADEAQRLAEARQAIALSGRRTSRADPVVLSTLDCKRSRLPAGLTLVYRITLRSSEGRVLSNSSCVVTTTRVPGKKMAGVNQLRSCLVAGRDGEVRRVVMQAIEAAVRDTTSDHARLQAAMLAREEAMRHGQPSAARQLVQIGLFDKRSLRAASTRDRATLQLEEDAVLRIAGTSAPVMTAIEVALAAALHVTKRSGGT